MKTIKEGNITIHIENDYEKMSKKGALLFNDQLVVDKYGSFGFDCCFSTLGMYKELIRMCNEEKLNFSQITTFNLNEYYPITKDNQQSCNYFMMNNLFDHVNIKKRNINIPNGEALDKEKECIDYENKIKEEICISLQILGIGNNGNIGFNEPSDCFSKRTHLVELTESTINANSSFFNDLKDVPKYAITMGIGTIMKAEKLLLIASGKEKADIIYKALYGNITPKIPASFIQLHSNVEVVIDEDAAQKILYKKNFN